MARRVRDRNLESREARLRLPVAGKPVYRGIANGLHLGYRRGKLGGKWVARFYLGRQKYAVETIADADDRSDADGIVIFDFWQAQELARKRHAELARTSRSDHTAGPYRVRDCIADYIEWLAAEEKYSRDVETRMGTLLLPVLGNIELAKLTTADIEGWHRGLAKSPPRRRAKDGAAPAFGPKPVDAEARRRRRVTANRQLTTFKAACNRAWRGGKVESDLAWRRVAPFGKVDAARDRHLSADECRRLCNAADPEFRPLVLAALQTGARYGELAALQCADVNLEAGTVQIRQSKSGQGRHVVLTEEGTEFFRQQIAGRSGAETIFLKRGQPWGRSHQDRPMLDACRDGNIDPPITFHILRHTWTSLAIAAGIPILIVARSLGHASTAMIEKYYGHLAPGFVVKEIREKGPRFGLVLPSNVATMERRR